ncbi:MAG: hypothetical protein HY725_03125 [Candidatus Rokubacteria bacterium]|nr:hypothetical protein [Candidatus Rokubacteria bacterium]
MGFLVLLAAVSWGLGALAAYPLALSTPDAAVLKIAFKHVAAFEQVARERSREELEKLPYHMRPQSQERARTGTRVATVVRLELNGRPLLEKTYRPSGFRHDGPTFAYEELAVPAGRHLLEATLTDAVGRAGDNGAGRRWRLREEVEIHPRRVLLVDFQRKPGLPSGSSFNLSPASARRRSSPLVRHGFCYAALLGPPRPAGPTGPHSGQGPPWR